MQRVNYDRIAHLFDTPERLHNVDANLIAYLEERADLDAASAAVLDVGCGTGRQAEANRAAFPEMFIVGADLFIGMLDVARNREPRVLWSQSDASRLGFRDHTFDYITNQFSYAHIQDKPAFFAEISRVLKPGGRFVVTNIDPWSMDNWKIYRYFPAARELDNADFLQADHLTRLLFDAGFIDVQARHDHHPGSERLGSFLDYASERHHTSQFLAISDADYSNGLEALKAAVDKEGPDALFDSEFCMLTVRADTPRS